MRLGNIPSLTPQIVLAPRLQVARLGDYGGVPTDEQIYALMSDTAAGLGEPRCHMAAALLPLVGLSYADPNTRAAYVAAVYPYDTQTDAYAMAAVQSSCGLVSEIAWRAAGVSDAGLYTPYASRVAHGQQAVAYEKKVATAAGAWLDCVTWIEGMPLPAATDTLIIGCNGCGSGWARNVYDGEHEFVVLAAQDGYYHSIDGGQPGIGLVTRAFVQVYTGQNGQGQRTGELWASTVDRKSGQPLLASDGRPSTGRRVVGFSQGALLPYGMPTQGTCAGGGVSGALSSAVNTAGSALPWVGLGLAVAGGAWWWATSPVRR